jgi:two-component system, OmpR family, phosphate regulon sensor histidine kinase PhoR
MTNTFKRPLYIFYLVVAYVLLQLGWWSYMIIQLNKEVHDLKNELIYASPNDALTLEKLSKELNTKLYKRNLMVSGEGAVFCVLLIWGIYQTRKSFKREEALARLQNNFLLSVTHELKTPLASTRLQLETLILRELPREKQKEIIDNALNDNLRLTRLIENILLASKIDNAALPLYKEKIELCSETEKLLKDSTVFKPFLDRISFHCSEKDLFVSADKDGYSSIMVNLMDNALKYSLEEKIEVTIAKDSSKKTIISVKDNGSGITNFEKEKVFQKFYRTGNEQTRNSKGTGLGLYIVKKLVDAHQWDLQIKDNTPKGTIFELTIPA